MRTWALVGFVGGHQVGGHDGGHPRPDPSQRQTCTASEAGNGTAYPTGLAEATCWKAAPVSDEAFEKTGAQTHKNPHHDANVGCWRRPTQPARHGPAESEGQRHRVLEAPGGEQGAASRWLRGSFKMLCRCCRNNILTYHSKALCR